MNCKIEAIATFIGVLLILIPTSLLVTDSHRILDIVSPMMVESAEDIISTPKGEMDIYQEENGKLGDKTYTLSTKLKKSSKEQVNRYKNLSGAINSKVRNIFLAFTSIPIGIILLISVFSLKKSKRKFSLVFIISVSAIGLLNFFYHYLDVRHHLRQKELEPVYKQERHVYKTLGEHISECKFVQSDNCTVLNNISNHYLSWPKNCWANVFDEIEKAGFDLPPYDLIVPWGQNCLRLKKTEPSDWSTIEN